MTKAEALANTTIGQIQSAGYMQIIPLVGDDIAPDIIGPSELMFSTNEYGSMTFENDSNKLAIIPSHTGYIIPNQGQDHAMTSAGLVDYGKKTFDNAVCIEASRCGGIRKDKYEFLILPFQLRNAALQKRTGTGFDRLWNSISHFNKRMGVKDDRGHLNRFFRQFEDTLDIFIAQFESVPHQVGAIILLDGSVIGVERAPSHEYFSQMWKAMIHSYGSAAIEFNNGLGENRHRLASVAELKGNLSTTEDILKAIENADKADMDFAQAVFDRLAGFTSINYKPDWSWVGDHQIATISPSGWEGQVIHNQGNEIVYASLVSTTGLR
jgi:hypothetical protein